MESENCFISICTPAYKRVDLLKRLIESIVIQTYANFEFIITDDSDDDTVKQLVDTCQHKLNIQYYKNEKALGSPGNMNFGMDKANGEWIKVMHDDDWFSSPNSLAIFAAETRKGKKFIFSAYQNCWEGSTKMELVSLNSHAAKRILKYPATLIAENVIGPPTVTMIHKSIQERYEPKMKWRVDQEFYMKILSEEKDFSYIPMPLVNIGVSESQVTNSCINIPSVELPEGYLLLEKYGTKPLQHIMVYDAWWRILRNLNITSQEQLTQFGQTSWPPLIMAMVKHLSRWPAKFLRIGIVSKFAMFGSYCSNYLKSNF